MKKKIAGYIRVSTAKQKNDGISLEMQQDMIIKHAMMLELINDKKDIEFYIDDGYSAKSLERPRLKELIENVKKNIIDLIFCYDLSRLSRDLFDCNTLLKLFDKHGAIFKCIYDHAEMKTASERYATNMKILNNQYEREKTIERTNDGLNMLAESGRYPGGGQPPFGYYRGEDKHLYAHPKDSLIIKKMFMMAAKGYSFREIEITVNTMEKSKNFYISVANIKRMIKLKKYYGYYKFKGKVYLNIIPAIIDENLYNLAQRITRKYAKEGENYIFSGRILCKECETFLDNTQGTSATGRVYFYYKCPKCKKYINENKLSDMFLVKEPLERQFDQKKEILKKIKLKKTRLLNRVSNIERKLINEQISDEEYILLRKPLDNEIKIISNEIESIKNTYYVCNRYENMLTKSEKRDYVENNVNKITFDLNSKEICFIEMK